MLKEPWTKTYSLNHFGLTNLVLEKLWDEIFSLNHFILIGLLLKGLWIVISSIKFQKARLKYSVTLRCYENTFILNCEVTW